MELIEANTRRKPAGQTSLKLKTHAAYVESLAFDQQQADALKENAILRQELESLRSELVKRKMENYMLSREITETKIANSALEKGKDMKKLQERLLNQAKNFLNHHPEGCGKETKLNLFESLFNCFIPAETSLVEQARHLDEELIGLLSERVQSSLKSELTKALKAIEDKHNQKRLDWLQQFQIGLKIQNYASSLELKLWSHRLISEFRNIVLNLASLDNKLGLLKALKSLENCLEAENI